MIIHEDFHRCDYCDCPHFLNQQVFLLDKEVRLATGQGKIIGTVEQFVCSNCRKPATEKIKKD